MAERYPGGVISKTPPVVTGPTGGEGGSASGVWTLDTVLEYEKAGAWPKPPIPFRLYGWGENQQYQLGDGTNIRRSSPVQVGSAIDWLRVAAGSDQNLAVKKNYTLWGWGKNDRGQLGLNSDLSESHPTQVGALTNWEQVTTGFAHSLAIKTDGTLWTWGYNSRGQLGDGTTINRSSPVQVGSLTTWTKVSAGSEHTVAIKTDGTLWAWGRGSYTGALGENNKIDRSSPVQVGALTNWAEARASYGFTIGVKTDGTLWAWGLNNYGNLGNNSYTNKSSPVQVGALTTWSQIGTGRVHVGAIKTDGTLWTWGSNGAGRLGDNTVVNKSSPVQVGALATWSKIQVDGRSSHTAAIKTDGTLWIWGDGGVGRLGLNTTINHSSPVQVGSLTTWIQASTGASHTTAIG